MIRPGNWQALQGKPACQSSVFNSRKTQELPAESHTSDCITWPWHDRQIRLWLKCSYYCEREMTACKPQWNINWHSNGWTAKHNNGTTQRHMFQVWQPASHFAAVYRYVSYASFSRRLWQIFIRNHSGLSAPVRKPWNRTQHASLICRCADWFTYRAV